MCVIDYMFGQYCGLKQCAASQQKVAWHTDATPHSAFANVVISPHKLPVPYLKLEICEISQ